MRRGKREHALTLVVEDPQRRAPLQERLDNIIAAHGDGVKDGRLAIAVKASAPRVDVASQIQKRVHIVKRASPARVMQRAPAALINICIDLHRRRAKFLQQVVHDRWVGVPGCTPQRGWRKIVIGERDSGGH